MWQVTIDMWHMTHGLGWTFSQNVSSLALTVWDFWSFEDLEEKDHSINQQINELVANVFIEQPQQHKSRSFSTAWA